MAVPAHDTRDYEFAKKFGIDIIEVIKGGDISKEAYTGDGEMVNSGELNGIKNKKDAIAKMLEVLAKLGCGEAGVQYKMKDWAFNRQRYWGEPIPIVHCEDCGMVAVPYEELPLRLPPIDDFKPGTDGESPLARIESFVKCKCPKCGKDARRETDTMPQWAGSSWYFLRYCDPHNDDEFAAQEELKYWLPVDWYNGGMEHVTRHMIYSRFWHKFLYDLGLVPTAEPYAKRTAQGLILGTDGEKMSKSRGNVVDPNDVVDEFGADVLRLYVLFMGDYEKAAPWSENSVKGCKRFVDRIWALQDKVTEGSDYSDALRSAMHKTIKKVTEDIEAMKFNTAIAAMMSLLNEIYSVGSITKKEFRDLLIILYPFAPHITEELYQLIGCEGILSHQEWVSFDEALCVDKTIEIVAQINGKIRAKLMIAADADKDEVLALAKADAAVAKDLDGKNIIKEIYVPGKLVNIVAK
ncbi:MAG: leucine--tRNA ligase, partial [Ruminococcus sp.]|nr:leucine--tRNA ligase [Ruminococcus sp.]